MAYRFKLNEGFAAGLRRIGEEQIERAIVQLGSSAPGVAVHETRKCLKRVRALLRLVRPGIEEAAFDRENARFRDIGRMLSGTRDRAVLLATINQLAAAQPFFRAALVKLGRSVAAMTEGNGVGGAELAPQVAERLDEARRDWQALKLEPDKLQPISEGLARGVRQLRAALEAAGAADDDAFHDWRKATQRHWRHMRLLQVGWPEFFEARAAEAKQVSDLLGAAQDLTLLLARIEGGKEHRLSRKQVRSLADMVRERRGMYRNLARERCSRLVAEGGEGLAKRCEIYWDAAGRLQDIEPKAAAAKSKPVADPLAPVEETAAITWSQPQQRAAAKTAVKGVASRRRKARRPRTKKASTTR